MFYKYYLYAPIEAALSGAVLCTINLYRFTHINPLQITALNSFPEMRYHSDPAMHHKVGCFWAFAIYGFFYGGIIGIASAGALIVSEHYLTSNDPFALPTTIEDNFKYSVVTAVSVAAIAGTKIMFKSIPRFSNIPVENLPTGIMFPEAEIFRPHDNPWTAYAKGITCLGIANVISAVPAIIFGTIAASIETRNMPLSDESLYNTISSNDNITMSGDILHNTTVP